MTDIVAPPRQTFDTRFSNFASTLDNNPHGQVIPSRAAQCQCVRFFVIASSILGQHWISSSEQTVSVTHCRSMSTKSTKLYFVVFRAQTPTAALAYHQQSCKRPAHKTSQRVRLLIPELCEDSRTAADHHSSDTIKPSKHDPPLAVVPPGAGL